MENILEIKSLRKEYDGFTLKDVSFQLPYGYIMGLIGPNGAGKTTTIKLIMNLLKKNGGEIKVFGKDHIEDEMEVKSRIGFVYDAPAFYEHLNLKQMKNIVAPFYKSWDDGMFQKNIEAFELPLKKRIKTLSRGMRMKFALAIALSHHAELIIMDEPTSGLDPVFRRELLDILSSLIQDERKSILFSTHVTSDLERIADYITFIHKGEVVFSRERDEIFENYGIIKGGKELLTEENDRLFAGVREHKYGIEALTPCLQEARKKFKNGAVIEKASLEDIMFLTGKGGGNV
ncbi:MAG: ABC transporter ATP-binding protein [bacterium]|nr:ABC transporter ATP-binding protein [bacterium]